MAKTETSERRLVGEGPFDRVYRWKNNAKRKHLFNKKCRILAYGTTMHSVLVEFEDGERVVTARRAVQRPRPRG